MMVVIFVKVIRLKASRLAEQKNNVEDPEKLVEKVFPHKHVKDYAKIQK